MRLLWIVLFALCAPLAEAQSFKIATLAPEGSTWLREMRAAADEVKQRTEGRVEFRYYPGGVMGDDATVMRKIRLGQLQGGALTGSELSLVYPDAVVYGLPFLFENHTQVSAVRREVDPLLKAGIRDKGFEVLSISGVGFAYMMSSKPLQSIEHLRAGKVWIPSNDRISERTFSSGGVSPIPLPLSDVFTSLQTGMIDIVGNTPAGAIALQWHTRIKHLFDAPLAYVVGFVVLDKRAFGRLSTADQAIVLEAFGTASDRIDAENQRADESAMAALRGEGIEFFTPDSTELARWREVGLSVRTGMVERGELSASMVDAVVSRVGAATP
ncbi:TRAP transporter substrate-binding protein DctP [Aquimonas voraii]|uniref:TRAP-type C4-dicarboxylate transport system, substrate-binding protein n=1 Tax=Aquimonas voraii TaxID=265719 RepID=A0A1G6V354_9GAMM|nr:TRAP transporter substrate-binding protein DctP [Aquimonas voraii]SDD47913.1 TRAP-type C4-dicarboxylate transport system, substrate-binding protein [Aquimonas voraii]